MSSEIKFQTPQKNKLHHRLNGNAFITFTATIPEDFVMPVTSDFAKKLKLLVYPDVLMSGKREITILNLSSYFVDLQEGDVLANLKKLNQNEPDEQKNIKKELSDEGRTESGRSLE